MSSEGVGFPSSWPKSTGVRSSGRTIDSSKWDSGSVLTVLDCNRLLDRCLIPLVLGCRQNTVSGRDPLIQITILGEDEDGCLWSPPGCGVTERHDVPGFSQTDPHVWSQSTRIGTMDQANNDEASVKSVSPL